MSIWDELEDVQRRLTDLEARLVYLEKDPQTGREVGQ